MLDDVANRVVFARRNNKLIESNEIDFLSKLSINQAYEFQKLIISGLKKDVSGWKLGGTNAKTRNVFNVKELYWGAVFNGDIVKESSKLNLSKGEVEVAFKLNSKIESLEKDITSSELGDYIESVALSVEYPWSVFESFGHAGVLALIADCCASGMCLLGKEIPFTDFSGSADVTINVDDVDIETGSTDNLVDDVDTTLCNFINNALMNKFTLTRDQWVFTGGITTCRNFDANAQVKIQCESLPGLFFIVS